MYRCSRSSTTTNWMCSRRDFFGFASLLDQTPHQTTATALEETRCIESTFILTFLPALVVYAAMNVYLRGRAWDPYPFILLNLMLSMLAAIQAPVIMMSQNRQDTKDRIRSELDYQVNLKSELGIMQLHEKFDELRREILKRG